MPPDADLARLRASLGGKRVCITGGAGFIGGHLCEALLSLGATVTCLDDLSTSTGDITGELLKREPRNFRFIYASILEPRALEEALAGVHVAFHLAAMGSVPRSIDEPVRCMEVNAAGTLRVAEACRSAGVQRWVFAASSSAYGDNPASPKVETLSPNPLSPYAASKLAGESIVSVWSRVYGLDGASLRYFNVFGPRQPADSAYAALVPATLARLTAGAPPVIFGDGTQTRDFTPVANAVHATLLAAACPTPLNGEVFNVGTGSAISVLEMVRLLSSAAGKPDLQPVFMPARPGDAPASLADVSKAASRLGYRPVSTLAQAVRETARAFTPPAAINPGDIGPPLPFPAGPASPPQPPAGRVAGS